MPSVKKNFLYSSVLTTANYIFPLLTYPYVSRILGVTNIGVCNFIDSIINYFVLFSMMGISTVGIREVAINKNNPQKLSSVFSSLLTLNAITTIIGIIVLAISTITVPKLQENIQLMFFGAFKLLFNLFLIEWFYKGLEDFRYVTMRTIIVKCFYVASVFIFVRKANDYPIYYLLTVLMVVVNAIINVIHSRKFVSFSFHKIELKKYLKPFFTLGLYLLLTSMYVSFNVIYLGFTGGDTQVGYYTTATKLYTILIALFSAFTGVMLPRMSSLIDEGRFAEFQNKLTQSINILMSFSIPAIIFMILLTPQIVLLISGPGYGGAIIPMRIIMPLMFIIGYEQILIVQTLMPLKKDKIIFRNSIIGAILAISLNIFLVRQLQAVGSAIVWLCCETSLLILTQIAVNKSIKLSFPTSSFLKTILSFLPMGVFIWLITIYFQNTYLQLSLSAIISILYFIAIELWLLKNEFIIGIINRFRL